MLFRSEKQTEEYKLLFRKYFLKSFASRLSEYTDPKITVLSEEVINNKYTIVFSKLEGYPDTTGTTTLTSAINESKSVYINEKGTITYE